MQLNHERRPAQSRPARVTGAHHRHLRTGGRAKASSPRAAKEDASMPRRHRCYFTVSLVLLALLAGFPSASPATAASDQDPKFTDVSDILSGRRSLLRTDDVIVIRFDAESHKNVAQTFWNPTANSRLTNDATYGLGEFILGNRTPASTSRGSVADNVAPHALGRMYNLPRDVLVSMLLTLDEGWNV